MDKQAITIAVANMCVNVLSKLFSSTVDKTTLMYGVVFIMMVIVLIIVVNFPPNAH